MKVTVKTLFNSFIDFFRDDGPILAGSISCFFVMTVVPFCLLLVSIFGYLLGGHKGFYDFLLRSLVSSFPAATFEITKELGTVITFKRIGIFTLFIYGVFSYQLYSALEGAVNGIFKQKGKRPFLISLMLSMSIVTLLVVFITISFGATSVIQMLKFLDMFIPSLVISRVTKFLVGFIVPFILVTLTVTSLYILLPKEKVRIRHALLGGLFTAIFLEAAKYLFTFYVALKLPQLGSVYGPLSAFIMFLLWIYYSACIFLVGAEVVYNLGREKQV